MVLIYKSI